MATPAKTKRASSSGKLRPDPGCEGVLRIHREVSATFPVGAQVLYFMDGVKAGQYAAVSSPYQLSSIVDREGPFMLPDGRRVQYRFGYGITLSESGKEIFAAAYQLTRDDLKPSYLRVAS